MSNTERYNSQANSQLASLESILRDILLSQVILREHIPRMNHVSNIRNTNGTTLIRVHLIPFTPSSERSSNPGNIEKITKMRNRHVAHLPAYRKLKQTHEIIGQLCSICHEKFKTNEYYRALPICNHGFHKKCIDRWLQQDYERMSCPVCREGHSPEQWAYYQSMSNCSSDIRETRATQNVTVGETGEGEEMVVTG